MRPKVLHIVLTLDVGGLEMFVCDLIQEYQSDVQSFVLCLERTGPMESFLGCDIPLIELHKKPGIRLGVIWQIANIIRSEGIDIVHTHNQSPNFYGSIAGRLTRTPVIHTKHGRNRPDVFRKILLNRISSLFTDKVVAVSSDAANLCRELERIRPDKIATILNGINTKKFSFTGPSTLRSELGAGDSCHLIGIVARLSPEKDHVTLLEAYSHLKKSGAHVKLVIIGDGPLRNALEQVVMDMASGGDIHFIGMRHDVPDLLRQLDLFVLSSLTEGISLTLLEAMCSRLAVVATDVGGNPEVVEDGVTGFIVPPRSPQVMAEKIHFLLNNAELRDSMGEAGRKRVLQRFSLSQAAAAYSVLYRQLLDMSS